MPHKCAICQMDNTSDRLLCLAQKNDGADYKTLAECVIGFSNLGCLPFNIVKLDEGDCVEETVRQIKTNVHKQCKLNYRKVRL